MTFGILSIKNWYSAWT